MFIDKFTRIVRLFFSFPLFLIFLLLQINSEELNMADMEQYKEFFPQRIRTSIKMINILVQEYIWYV